MQLVRTKMLIVLMLLLLAPMAYAADVNLAWDANTEPDLAGYKIYWGDSEIPPFANAADAGNVTSYTVTGLSIGSTYYFAATAYDSAGNESGYSDILKYTVPPDRLVIEIPVRPKKFVIIFE
jgi:hypothetical protein